MLDDSDSESSASSSSLNALKINDDYAKAFAYRKEREELTRLKDKYGSDGSGASDDDDSDSETEDEDGEELTPAVDAAILRTLARIRRKDPNIYEAERKVFAEEQERTSTSQRTKAKKEKSKPLTIKQHALNAVLSGSRSPSPVPEGPTHVEEQQALRDETIRAFTQAADAEEDDFLVPREKTKDELEMEEEEYRAFLEREVGEDIAGLVEVETEEQWRQQQRTEDNKKDKKSKKKADAKGKSKERDDAADQKFLLDYILNRGWIDKSERHVPTYKEVTSRSSKKRKADEDSNSAESNSDSDAGGVGDIDEESVFEEAVEHFEEDYQYRYQEPGAATINVHPRKIPTLVRREDTRRKEARERRKARKEEEMLRKREEVKRLKALKLKELRRKLERIGREGGKAVEDAALEALDLDAEWDPEKHDAQMADIYDDEAEGIIEVDDDKPQWDDDIDVGDIMPSAATEASSSKKQKKKKNRKRGDADDPDAAVDEDAMDADIQHMYDPDEEWDGTEDMRKRKLQEYMDTLDEMEFNDIVGGMPTRFKYTSVASDQFGLTPAEILMATDQELNQYVSVKRYAPYRKSGANWDSTRGEKLRELRDKLKERGAGAPADASEGEKKKRKGKKERMREKAATEAGAVASSTANQELDGAGPKKKKKKRKTQEGGGDEV
ncbi:hypothetical protein EXIGLDRAFT_836921 [Exidia glandulosa HHB12029]|uniref:Kri1-like C-terminal domain-containing protein n=1 Tax=Exidia glandulosa HHB12029 TaxID=1314781 RepID=A0A165HB95_EXIGL|nr:hypothetical protein EXIGLDRAFT_836921 [Exidia glandulosa HHB12029]